MAEKCSWPTAEVTALISICGESAIQSQLDVKVHYINKLPLRALGPLFKLYLAIFRIKAPVWNRLLTTYRLHVRAD